VRTWCSNPSWAARAIAWLIVGVSASQLAQDIDIMENRIRLKKPCLVKGDGPSPRVNAWLKQFYSQGSAAVGHGAGSSANPMAW
jgi:hypothetical protein